MIKFGEIVLVVLKELPGKLSKGSNNSASAGGIVTCQFAMLYSVYRNKIVGVSFKVPFVEIRWQINHSVYKDMDEGDSADELLLILSHSALP